MILYNTRYSFLISLSLKHETNPGSLSMVTINILMNKLFEIL